MPFKLKSVHVYSEYIVNSNKIAEETFNQFSKTIIQFNKEVTHIIGKRVNSSTHLHYFILIIKVKENTNQCSCWNCIIIKSQAKISESTL